MDAWKKNLVKTEIEFMESFIEQVPEDMGVREMTVRILNKIGSPPRPRPDPDDDEGDAED